VADSDHQHEQSIVLDGVHDAIVADAHTVSCVGIPEFLTAMGPRFPYEPIEDRLDSQLNLPRQPLQFALRGWLEYDAVTHRG
jgi:hypothetical protein